MGLHKLTAGDGYTYLTRQVAVQDATDRGHRGLGDYYSEKGESPGRWFGTGVVALGLHVGDEVTEQQMRNLFGEGRHPDAQRLEDAALDAGEGIGAAKRASQLGRVFAVYRGNAPEFLQEAARRFTAYNYERGLHWKTPVPDQVRQRIRTELGNEMFTREHGRAPLDDRERGGFLAQATRQKTTAVAGYDLTFTPVKSVSTLWAVADREVARQVEDAHHAAVEQTLKWLEQEVLFTRRGRGGVQQVKAMGLVAGLFTHRDSRSADPHLHTHVAVSNKVQDATGAWLAVDGRVLYKANVTLSETYNTLLEAELVARLGVRFQARRLGLKTGASKRPVREIVGIDERLAASWSKRNSAIEARRRELAAAFQTEHGRPPTEGEAATLRQQAWEQTRAAKHAPRAEVDQRAAWRAEAISVLGSDMAITNMVESALRHHTETQPVTDAWVAKAALEVVERVAEDRATWQVWHLRPEAQRQARAASVGVADLGDVVDRILKTAIAEHSIAFPQTDPLTEPDSAADVGVGIPAALTREDGSSVYSLAGGRLYTSRAVLDAEHRIIEAASRTGGRRISEVRVGIAVAESAANGVALNAAQQSLVREMATSGRQVQLALAPAGTGKTTAMATLTRAWQDSGGTVIGLAPSAVAAEQLGSAINSANDAGITDSSHTSVGPSREGLGSGSSDGDRESDRRDRGLGRRGRVRSDTVDKLVFHARYAGPTRWMEQIDAKTLVLIDEAGMASTANLATAIDYITARGGQVRLVGDDRQLASVAAGGVLRDIARTVGAVTLTEVHRFRNRDGSLNLAEAAATLAVREGDPSAVGFYADRGRIHVGDLGSCADQAYAAWAADRAQGTDSVLIAPTRDLVAELNTRARNDRLAATTPPRAGHNARHRTGHRVGRVLTLGDGTSVSAGDRVITRENKRELAISRTDWVKNGDRWTVAAVHADGSLSVVHDRLGKRVRLPADYVAQKVQLGYATTIHGAQGITTGTCHVVLTGEEDRNLLYVALSRGQYANHLYLSVSGDGDPHNLIRPEALIPPTALDKLGQILGRDGSPTSATSALRDHVNPAQLLTEAAARYHDALTFGAEQLLGPDRMERIDTYAATLTTSIESETEPEAHLVDAPAWPTLRSHLALLALDGHDPLMLLITAIRVASLADARDPAAVLEARIEDHLAGTGHDSESARPVGPLPWLPAVPARLAEDTDWGPYLAAREHQVRDRALRVAAQARDWAGGTAPAWAQPFLEDAEADLRAELAVWRAATSTSDSDLRPVGARTIGAPGDYQARLARAVRRARPSYPFAQRSWYQALPDAVRADPWVTPLCQRLARLERAGLPVTDYLTTALTTDPTAPVTAGAGCLGGERSRRRSLPDEHPAAALWWRLIPHLGPAALDADPHSADLLKPAWRSALADLVGSARTDYLQHCPAWPALVAAVDEACLFHGWSPDAILAAGLAGIPQDGTLTGVEVADALVLRIAALTDPPPDMNPRLSPDSGPGRHQERRQPGTGDQHQSSPSAADGTGPEYEPDQIPPDDLDVVLADLYRDRHAPGPLDTQPTAHPVAQPVGVAAAQLDDDAWDGLANDPFYEPNGSTTRELVGPAVLGSNPDRDPDADPDASRITTGRLLDLNARALAYYESCYPRSWAPAYLRERLGTDPVSDLVVDPAHQPRIGLADHLGRHLGEHPAEQPVFGVGYAVGYAPAGPRSLLTHLVAQGATADELEQAGLIRTRERRDGTLEYVDAFRDRLVMPIHDPHDPAAAAVIGFLGRRNPTKEDDPYAGPKYLNTKNTPLFTKGKVLFGYAEAREALAAGALPVIVEGPMDAYAITVGSCGAAVGLAPMGTALTVDQIKLLLRHVSLTKGRDRIVVATDADAAGWKSAQAAFWNLTTADLDPTCLVLPEGLDPAGLLHAHGPEAIRAAISDRAPLGEAMINQLLATTGAWSDPAVRQQLTARAAQIIAARGADVWRDSFTPLNRLLHLSPGFLEHLTIAEAIERDQDRGGWARRRIEELRDQPRPRHLTQHAIRPSTATRLLGTPPAADAAARTDAVKPGPATTLRPALRPATGSPVTGRDPGGDHLHSGEGWARLPR